jgi:hypothetical protein
MIAEWEIARGKDTDVRLGDGGREGRRAQALSSIIAHNPMFQRSSHGKCAQSYPKRREEESDTDPRHLIVR